MVSFKKQKNGNLVLGKRLRKYTSICSTSDCNLKLQSVLKSDKQKTNATFFNRCSKFTKNGHGRGKKSDFLQ